MRKKQAEKRIKVKDLLYNSFFVNRLIIQIMQDGKKNLAQKIVYKVLETLEKETKLKGNKILEEAINNIKPQMELKSRKIGGANYRIPIKVNEERGIALAFRWLVEECKKRSEKTMVLKLKNEIIEATKKSGNAIKKRETIQKMAEANKAFAYYSW